jgi:hypothetical protein
MSPRPDDDAERSVPVHNAPYGVVVGGAQLLIEQGQAQGLCQAVPVCAAQKQSQLWPSGSWKLRP